jgi:putative transcriptional regulator
MIKIEFGQCLLLELLHKRGMTQIELSEKTGISPQQISEYITGKRKMSYLNAVKISMVLKCHADDLYKWIVK